MENTLKIHNNFNTLFSTLVPLAGIEPARPCGHLILSQARLPIPPQGLGSGIIAAGLVGSTAKCGFRAVDRTAAKSYRSACAPAPLDAPAVFAAAFTLSQIAKARGSHGTSHVPAPSGRNKSVYSGGNRGKTVGAQLEGTGTMHGVQTMAGSRSAVTAAILVAAVGAATILGAYYFQYVKELSPCPLCLEQRIAYYVSIPLAVVVAIAAARGAPRSVVATGLGIIALAMLFNAALALFHAGVEWHWWLGPQECSGAQDVAPPGGDIWEDLKKGRFVVVRCDEAAWRDPFGLLSLAGYNVLISLTLALVAARGAVAAWQQGSSRRRA
jgi:disulfide bond formation protein DsbB